MSVKRLKLKVGDPVHWRSQAGGNWKAKAGVVVKVVPAFTPPGFSSKKFLNDVLHDGGGSYRNHESYIVAVTVTKKRRHIYWPVVSQLRCLRERPQQKGTK